MNKRAVTRAAAVACAIARRRWGQRRRCRRLASTTRAPSKTSAAVQLRALRLGLAHPDAAGRAILEHLRASAQAGPSQNRGSTPLSGACRLPTGRQCQDADALRADPVPHASTAATCAATASRVVDVGRHRKVQRHGHLGLPRGGENARRQRSLRRHRGREDGHGIRSETTSPTPCR